MNKFLLISILIFCGLAILGLGIWLGVFYQQQQQQKMQAQLQDLVSQKNKLQTEVIKAKNAESVVQSISSNVVSKIMAGGQVKNINGNLITISHAEINLTFSVPANAQIVYLSSGASAAVAGGKYIKQIGLKDINVGDELAVNLKLLPDGSWESQYVSVISKAAKIK